MKRKLIILSIFLVALLAVSAVSAQDNATSDIVSVEETQVNLSENNGAGTFDDLQSEINNAPAGSTLNLTRDYNGAYGSRIQFNKDLTIDGQGHTLDCLGESGCSAFYSESGNITLKNLIIINGYNDFTGKGGAIYIVGSAQYTIINCTFNNNWAKGFGGAIYSEANKPLTIINCSFNNNKANYINGGAIYWFNVNDCTVTNCNFTGNTANNGGGAIYGERATTTVTNCSFTGNTANNGGGAIYWYFDVNAAVTNCSFTGNTANNNSGGAIYWNGANGAVTNCNFTDNKANNNSGGAIYWIGANGNITDCTFIGNTARFNGGAIYWIGANGTVTHCNFTGNIARHGESGCGGAIHWNGDNGAVTHCNFIGNTARCNGGAVYWNSANGAVTHCNFTRNSADPAGGAVYWEGANGNITDCNFTGNKAVFNGGAVYWNGVNGAVTHCNFTDNTASGVYAGGAVYWEGVNGAVTHCNFTGNTANYGYGAYGGAINWEGANGTVTHCNFIGNTASKNGGAIYWQRENDADGNIADCTFIRNSAIWGGAIYWKGVNGTVTHCNFTGNTASYGGAIYWWKVNDCTVTYCNFKSNTAKGGGAIFWYLGVSGTVTHCNFTDNTANWAKDGGGAIYTGSSVKCVDSIFSGNSAYQDGGAIYAEGNVDVKNSIFENNKAEGAKGYECYGGAIRSEKDVKIDNCSFLNNHASNYGGAISSDTITWVNNLPSYFIGNYAEKNEGGAIYTDKFTTDIKYGVFINNTVKSNNDGGAIYINRENHLLISQCYFENNRCEDEGGAIYLESTSSTLILEYNIFVDNWAGKKGNIVYNKGKYNKIHNNWYGVNNFDFSNELVEYNAWGSDESQKDDEMVIVELSLNETNAGEPSTLIVTFPSDEELFNYDAKFSADNGAILSNHKIGNNTVTSDITFDYGITTVTATVNHQVLKLSYSYSKENVTMNINAPEISFGDNATVNIIFTPNNATGTVSVENISSDIVNGTARVIIPNLPVGNHTLQVIYSGDGVYNPKQANVTITVNRKNLNINASAEPIHEGENATVIVNGLEYATGNVTVTINNTDCTGKITNGTATINIPGLNETTTANVTYIGDANYTNASTTVTIVVNPRPKENLTINASADPIMLGEDATVIVNGLENATGNVTVKIGSDEWYGEINNGKSTIIVTGLKMNATATVFYAGDYKYNNATTTVDITVNPAITVWYVNGNKQSSGNGTTPDTAFKTLKEALNKAPEDSTIYIVPGTYTGKNNTNLTINKNLTFTNYGAGEVIFDAQGLSGIWAVNAGRINITGLTFKNGKEEYVCGAILFNQTLDNSYINAIFINNSVVEGLAGAIGFYADVINTDIHAIFISNSVNDGYGGAIFFNGDLNNVNITGNYTSNTAGEYGGAILFNGDLNNVNISGNYTSNTAGKYGGAIFFNGNLIDVNISGYYNNNQANNSAGVFLFNNNLTNVIISGDYTNNHAKNGISLIWEAHNVSISGNYVNNDISDGSVIYIVHCDENSIIHDSIFINNTKDDELIIDAISDPVLALNNWFGNNASNYNIKPEVSENVAMTNWLFLNATTNTTGEMKINETAEITFKLYAYNSTSEEINEYDASKMNIQLDLSPIHGTLDQPTAFINETILYTCKEEGIASVTGKFETASYTIYLSKQSTEIIIDKTEITLNASESVSSGATLNPPEAGNLTYTSSNSSIAIVEDGYIKALSEGTATITVSFAGSEKYAAAENKTINVNVRLNDASVSVNNSTLDLAVGEKFNIVATTTPEGLDITYIPDNSGVVSVNENGVVTALKNGTATITVKVGGDGIYAENSTTVTVTVSKIPTEINIATNTLDLKVLENFTAGATLTPADAGNLTYTSSNSSVAIVENGYIKAFSEGSTTITVSFEGNEKYATAENKTITVNVSLKDASVSVNNSTVELLIGENFTIVATTVPSGLNVTYVPDNSGIVSVDENGVVTALKAGTATITVKVGGDGIYAENSTTVTVTVSKIPTEINIATNTLDLKVLENFTAGATLTPADAGNLTYTSSNSSIALVEDGYIKALSEGTATITVSFEGNEKYATAENKTITVNVSLKDASVTVNNSTLDLIVGDNFTIVATTTPEGLDVTYVPDDSGVVSVDANGIVTALKSGTANITVKVGGDGIYTENSTTATVTVIKANVTLTIDSSDVVYPNDVVVTIKSDVSGNYSLFIGTSSPQYIVLEAGVAHDVTYNGLNAGTYEFTVALPESDKYNAARETVNVTVNKVENTTISVEVDTPVAGENATVTVTLPANATGTVEVKYGNGVYIAPVVDGTATVSVPTTIAGTETASVTYSGDNNYASASSEVNITVKVQGIIIAENIKRGVNSSYDYYATLVNAEGQPISDVEITFTIDGKTYKAKTNASGIAVVSAGLTVKDGKDTVYDVTVTNPYTLENTTATTTIVPRLIVISGDLTADYLENPPYIVQAIGDDGEHVGANVTVRIVFAGFYYDLQTNETGHVVRTIGLAPGTYAVRGEYLGYKTEQTPFQVLQILQASSGTLKKTAKTYTLKATLKHTNGKAISGKTVKLIFNGKTYTAKTNSKGVASYTIKSSVINKLKAGKTYVLKAQYVNDITKGKWQGKIKVVKK